MPSTPTSKNVAVARGVQVKRSSGIRMTRRSRRSPRESGQQIEFGRARSAQLVKLARRCDACAECRDRDVTSSFLWTSLPVGARLLHSEPMALPKPKEPRSHDHRADHPPHALDRTIRRGKRAL
jgi:hypothetical protein